MPHMDKRFLPLALGVLLLPVLVVSVLVGILAWAVFHLALVAASAIVGLLAMGYGRREEKA